MSVIIKDILMKFPKSVFLFSILLFTFAVPHFASAGQSAGIKLVPATIEKAANPGDVIPQTLKVTNEKRNTDFGNFIRMSLIVTLKKSFLYIKAVHKSSNAALKTITGYCLCG